MLSLFVFIDVDPLPDFIELASVEGRIGSQQFKDIATSMGS